MKDLTPDRLPDSAVTGLDVRVQEHITLVQADALTRMGGCTFTATREIQEFLEDEDAYVLLLLTPDLPAAAHESGNMIDTVSDFPLIAAARSGVRGALFYTVMVDDADGEEGEPSRSAWLENVCNAIDDPEGAHVSIHLITAWQRLCNEHGWSYLGVPVDHDDKRRTAFYMNQGFSRIQPHDDWMQWPL